MTDQFLAEIRIFAFVTPNPPSGWARCDGQLMPISQNTALFSLLGTTYGGDGKSTFALPDLAGSAPMSHTPNQLTKPPGLSSRDLGELSGSETVTLLQSEIPVHIHGVRGSTEPADVSTAGPTTALTRANGQFVYAPATANLQPLAPQALSPAGGNQPHNNMMPYLVLNICIALQGVFPPRS